MKLVVGIGLVLFQTPNEVFEITNDRCSDLPGLRYCEYPDCVVAQLQGDGHD